MTIRFSSRGLLACIIATAAACSGNDGAQEFDARLLGPIDASPLPAVDANPQSVIDASAVSIDAQRAQSDGALAFDASRPVDAGIVDAKPVSDAAPSLTTVVLSKPTAITATTSIVIEFDASSEATFQCQLDSAAPAPCHSPAALRVTTQGPHQFVIDATGINGVVAAPVVVKWILDNDPPTVAITSGPSYNTENSGATFAFSSAQAQSFLCQVDGAIEFTPCTSPWVMPTTLSQGSYQFRVRAVDAAGGYGEADYQWNIVGAYCGNGIIDSGEACDGGGGFGTNVCSADCQTPVFAGGTGIISDPLQIATTDQLLAANNPVFQNASFLVVADLDLTNVPMEPFGFQSGEMTYYFEGTFDGGNHPISNWSFTSTNNNSNINEVCVGFFGYLYYGTASNITLVAPQVDGQSAEFTGGLVGCAYGALVIRDHVVGGTVTAEDGSAGTGGLVGFIYPFQNMFNSISNSSSSASVVGNDAGGLVGYCNGGAIVDSFATGEVNGSQAAGGLMPYAPQNIISRTYAAGVVDTSACVGGFDCTGGGVNSSVTESFWDIDSSGQTSSIDGTGLSAAQMAEQSSFTGWDFTNVWQIEAGQLPTLRQDGDVAPIPQQQYVNTAGGSSVSSSIQALDVDGDAMTYNILSQPAQGTLVVFNGNQFTYTPASWAGYQDSFTYVVTDSHGLSSPVMTLGISVTAACNPAEPRFTHGGDGSAGNPYVLTNVAELELVREYTQCNFILGADIDLTGVDFPPIGDSSNMINNTFDGAGFQISNWTYSLADAKGDQVGFFWEADGVVRNLSLVNANVNVGGSYYVGLLSGIGGGSFVDDYVSGTIVGTASATVIPTVGGMVGYFLYGELSDCISDADVTGDGAGGILGMGFGASLERSSATGTISGKFDAGGLIASNSGFNNSFIDECFATGAVSASGASDGTGGTAGGLIAFDGGGSGNYVSNSYATGAVVGNQVAGAFIGNEEGSGADFNNFALGKVTAPTAGGLVGTCQYPQYAQISNSYWDIDTTGVSTSATNGATGESDSAMKQSSTYAGFDFSNTWTFGPSGYPVLR